MAKPKGIGLKANENQPTSLQDCKIKKDNNVTKPTIRIFMTEAMATEEGEDVLKIFHQFDKNKNKKIDTDEILQYSGIAPKELSEKEMKDNHKKIKQKKPREQLQTIVEASYRSFGLENESKQIIQDVKENKNIDSHKLLKEKFGIDLSEYKTKSEKKDAFISSLKSRYDDDLNNKDSLYAKNFERIKQGNYTDYEKDVLGVKGDLTDKQIAEIAKLAMYREQVLEITSFFANSDDEGKEYMISALSSFSPEMQTALIATAIYSANDDETRKMYANWIESKGVKLSGTNGNEMVFYSASALMEYLDTNKQMSLLFGEHNSYTGHAQHTVLQAGIVTSTVQYENGEITEDEYNQRYTKYAENAYKLKDADLGYEYLINNTNDSNRQGVLNVLAMNASKITDETQRSNAINTIRSSNGYNEEVELNILNGYLNKNSEKNSPVYINSNQDYNSQVNEMITSAVKTEGKEAVSEAVSKYTESVEKSENIAKSKRVQELLKKSTSQILDIIVGQNLVQGTKYERVILKHLSAVSTPTLTGIFLSSTNQKTQTYLWNHRKEINLSIINIAYLGTNEQINDLPDKVKEPVNEILHRQPKKAFD